MLSVRQISLTGRPASASLRVDTICVSVNVDWRMGTSWLGWVVCQKVLLFDCLLFREAYGGIVAKRLYDELFS